MKQAYISPAMQVVEIKKNDVIVTSPNRATGNVFDGDITGSTEPSRSAGLRFDEWYEVY